MKLTIDCPNCGDEEMELTLLFDESWSIDEDSECDTCHHKLTAQQLYDLYNSEEIAQRVHDSREVDP